MKRSRGFFMIFNGSIVPIEVYQDELHADNLIIAIPSNSVMPEQGDSVYHAGHKFITVEAGVRISGKTMIPYIVVKSANADSVKQLYSRVVGV